MVTYPLLPVVGTLGAACVLLTAAYLRSRARTAELARELERAEGDAVRFEDALRQRKHLDTIKDEFISTVSHELRTPLTSIRGALGLLSSGMMGPVDDKAANLLRIASTNTDRLVRLINDILDLERMDSGRAPMQMRPCSPRELVVQAVDTMASLAHTAEVRLEIAPEPVGLPAVFAGDPDRVQQVLVNLLSNAIKFSPRGGTVRIATSFDEDSLLLRVEDAGRGVPADKLESIFERFQQVESGDARVKGGTGLGLAICRTILAQHNGAIWAERNDQRVPGRAGSTFLVRVPRSYEAEREAQPVELSGSGHTVLVVDDDASVRHVVAEHLRRHGYEVFEVANGEQAVHIAQTQRTDAILLDLYMPGMTGWQTIERLKGDERTAHIPVVVLSVLSPATREADGPPLVANAQGWVQKPFSEGLLLGELGRVLHAGAGPGRILLVEDDEDLATVVLSSFEETGAGEGVHLHHVTSLAAAQQSCQLAPPDLMILDLTLPDGTGFALVEWLRGQPDLRTLPLVVYSGREVSTAEREQLRLGPTQFLAKTRVQPRDVEELVLAMIRHLRAPALRAAS